MTRLSLGERVAGKIREALGHLRTIRLTGPERFGLEVDLKGADEGSVTSDLTDLFLQLGEAAKSKERGVVFLLDEVQFADEVHFRAMISALHRATQRTLPIAVAAAGLPQIPRLTGEARSYAERLFTFPTIDNLGEEAAVAALTEPARQTASTLRLTRSPEQSGGRPAIRSSSSNSESTLGMRPTNPQLRSRTSTRRFRVPKRH